MVDIYNLEERYTQLKNDVDNWQISPYNKKLILEHLTLRVENKLSPGKKTTTIWALKAIFNGTSKRPRIIDKDFDQLTIKDFEAINAKIWGLKLKAETHKFYNWLIKKLYYKKFSESEEKEKQSIINKLQSKEAKLLENQEYVREVTEDETITIDELKIMLNRSTRPIEKALLVTAFEGTKRPNEYLTAEVGGVQVNNKGFIITITPSKAKHKKNDKAKLYVYELKSYFADFWNAHPYKDNPKAPLFYREDLGSQGKPLGGAGANKILRKLGRLCGIQKRISLYSFRRGGYSWKIKRGMNKALAGRDMGWRPGSSQEKNYLNITDDDVEMERSRLAGKELIVKHAKEIRDKTCPWCYHINAPGLVVCENCGKELDLKKILEQERVAREKERSDLLKSLLTDPRMSAMLEAVISKSKVKK